jgi:hypothetical protein
MNTGKVTMIGYFESGQNGAFMIEHGATQIVGEKIQVPGHSHGISSGYEYSATFFVSIFSTARKRNMWVTNA